MTAQQIKAIFNKFYNGDTNFMTPHVISHEHIGDYGVELSSGSGFAPGSSMHGVTVLANIAGDPERSPLSTGGFDLAAANAYIDTIRKDTQ